MPETNTTTQTEEAQLTTAELHHALKQNGAWKTGVQFLTNVEKETLLIGTDEAKEAIYKIVDSKNKDINKKLSELNRSSFEVNEAGEIELSYKEDKATELITNDSVDGLKIFTRPIKVVPVGYSETEEMNLDSKILPTSDYQAIVNKHNNSLISIVKDTYKVVPNADIINPLMEQMSTLDNKWYIDPSHSFSSPKRIRLQITFPELTFKDDDSDIPLSLFLHNSYDGTEGVRMMWGAIRLVCSNGMVLGKVLGEFYGRHTKNFELGNLKEQIENTYKMIPSIQAKMDELQETKTTRRFIEKIKTVFGERTAAYVKAVVKKDGNKAIANQWLLYNVLTYYFSHAVQQKMRAQYQLKASALFGM